MYSMKLSWIFFFTAKVEAVTMVKNGKDRTP